MAAVLAAVMAVSLELRPAVLLGDWMGGPKVPALAYRMVVYIYTHVCT